MIKKINLKAYINMADVMDDFEASNPEIYNYILKTGLICGLNNSLTMSKESVKKEIKSLTR